MLHMKNCNMKSYYYIKVITFSSLFLCLVGTSCVTSVSRESINNINTQSALLPADYNPSIGPQSTPKPVQAVPASTPQPTKTLVISTPTETLSTKEPIPTKGPKPTNVPSPTPDDPTPSTPAKRPESVLQILGPLNNSSFTSDSVIIYGISQPGSSITINDSLSQIDSEGNFYAEVELTTGMNQFTIQSHLNETELAMKTLNIFKSAPQTLFISITKPLNQTVISASHVQISGLTSPDAKLYIGGLPIPITIERLDPANTVGLFDHLYALGPGLNLIDVRVTNDAGDSIDKLISVIYSD